ncbi:MAG TPA: rubrerythrin family protein [Candidatus Koribacter sp.]|jgi:rubrerythrin
MANAAVASATLEHLQTAYDGESNARVRYRLFAVQADLDGYRDVASLFRAAARAEQVHAENHARVIRSMGAEPKRNILSVHVDETAKNLETAILGEEYERDVMYPEFVAEAKESRQNAAARSFAYAMEVEAVHAQLFRLALERLKFGLEAVKYYVCLVCGFTTRDVEIAKCLVCSNPRERFEIVS